MTNFTDGGTRTTRRSLLPDGGEFDRPETDFRDRIEADPDAEFPAEAGRYHLYISRACPWAHGAALVRKLYGLEDVISMDIVDPYRDERGWMFTPGTDEECTPDTVNGFDFLAEVYEAAAPGFSAKPSVPVLWDRERDTIVNNESIEIMRMLATAFDEFATTDADLYPAGRRDDIDDVVDRIYDPINNGVYRAGFATTQDAYEAAVTDLFDALDYWEGVLDDQRYLLGDELTLADVRLFPTLVRFDPVYNIHFKCSLRRLVDYPNLWNYTKDVYQHPGVAETVNMDHITEHYYTTHESVNPKRIVPLGPDVDFTEPHDRDQLSAGAPSA